MSDGLSVLRRVYGLPDAGTPPADSPVEEAVLRQSAAALDALPARRPSPGVIDAVLAEAAAVEPEAASLAAVRYVYDLGPRPTGAGAEVALLEQSRDAVATLPTASPDDAAVDAVRAQAGAATVAPVLAVYGDAAAPEGPETVLLEQSRAALDALPRHRPSPSALAAVLAAAADASRPGASPASSPAARRAPDRAAAPAGRLARRRVALFAGASTLAAALVLAVVFARPDAALDLGSAEVAALAETDAAPSSASGSDALVESADEALASTPETEARAFASPVEGEIAAVVPRGPSPSAAPSLRAPASRAPARRAVPRSAARPTPSTADVAAVSAGVTASRQADREAIRPEAAAAFAAEADLAPAAEPVGAWDASGDVPGMALRLRQLRERNQGLAWDGPSEPFGVPSASSEAPADPGIRAVREGAPVPSARSRAQRDTAETSRETPRDR